MPVRVKRTLTARATRREGRVEVLADSVLRVTAHLLGAASLESAGGRLGVAVDNAAEIDKSTDSRKRRNRRFDPNPHREAAGDGIMYSQAQMHPPSMEFQLMARFPAAVLETAMREVLGEARQAAQSGEFPFGAVVVSRQGVIVARTQDTVARTGDPTRHAEIDCVRLAVAAVGADLSDYALVSNVEPCAMCSTAAWWARIGTIAFGLSVHALKRLRPEAVDEPGPSVEELMGFFERKLAVVPDVLAAECEAVWKTA